MIKYINESAGIDVFPGVPFVANGLSYPANWLDLATDEEIAAAGLVAVEVDEPVASDVVLLPPVPVCTPWQIRKALNALGLRDMVEAAVSTSDVMDVRDGWQFATSFRADDPFVLAIGASIGKSSDEVAEIIAYASLL